MKALLTAIFCLSVSAVAQAYDPLADDDTNHYYRPEKEWIEGEASLPKQFDANDLQPFTLKSGGDGFDYAIERRSLQTGSDGVTRFTVVIRSKRGAINSSYEGLRCGHREYRVYAYGSGQGLTPMDATPWTPIPRGSDDYHARLYEDLICNQQTGQPNPPEAAFRAMRQDRLAAPSTIFGHD